MSGGNIRKWEPCFADLGVLALLDAWFWPTTNAVLRRCAEKKAKGRLICLARNPIPRNWRSHIRKRAIRDRCAWPPCQPGGGGGRDLHGAPPPSTCPVGHSLDPLGRSQTPLRSDLAFIAARKWCTRNFGIARQ